MDPPYRGNIVDELNKKIDNSEAPEIDSFFSLDLLPPPENTPPQNKVQERQEQQGMWPETAVLNNFLSLEPFCLGLNIPQEQGVHESQELQTQLSETSGLNTFYSLDLLNAGSNISQDQGTQSVPVVKRLQEEEIIAEELDRRELEEETARKMALNTVDSTETPVGSSAAHAAMKTSDVFLNPLEEQMSIKPQDKRELKNGMESQVASTIVDNSGSAEKSSAANAEMQTVCILDSTQDGEIGLNELYRREIQDEIANEAALSSVDNSETTRGILAAVGAIQTTSPEEDVNQLLATNGENQTLNLDEDHNQLSSADNEIQTDNSKGDNITVTALKSANQSEISTEENTRLKCDLCEATFTLKRSLGRHRNISHKIGTSRFTCLECERRFRNQRELDNHTQKIHNVDPEEKKWQCTKCQAFFTSNMTLKNHMRVVHDEQSGKFRCNECNIECYNRSHLQDHIQAVHRNVVHTCSTCGKSYRYRYDLAKHKRNKNH